MTESKLFLSSCDRRELTRRRSRSWLEEVAFSAHPALIGMVTVMIGVAAFLLGRGVI